MLGKFQHTVNKEFYTQMRSKLIEDSVGSGLLTSEDKPAESEESEQVLDPAVAKRKEQLERMKAKHVQDKAMKEKEMQRQLQLAAPMTQSYPTSKKTTTVNTLGQSKLLLQSVKKAQDCENKDTRKANKQKANKPTTN